MAKLKETTNYLKISGHPCDLGLILGSGLGEMTDRLQLFSIPYEEIPHFPISTVEGHAGRLVVGSLAKKRLSFACEGRFHYYEGYTMEEVTYP